MQKKIRIAGMLLFLISILACGVIFLYWYRFDHATPVKEPVQSERIYQETEKVKADADGSLYAYKDDIVFWDGSVFREIHSGKVIYELPESWHDLAIGRNCTFDAQGNMYMVVYDDDAKMHAYSSAHRQSVPLQSEKSVYLDAEKTSSNLRKFLADENYLYVLLDQNSSAFLLQVFTMEGVLYWEMDVTAFTIDQRGRLFTADEKGTVHIYQMQNKEQNHLFSVAYEEDYRVVEMALDPSANSLLLMMNEHAYLYEPENGSLSQKLFDRTTTMLECSTLYFDGVAIDGDHNIYCKAQADDLIYSYEKAEAKKEATYTLTITAPYPDPYIEQIAALYERDHPEWAIEFDCAYASNLDFFNNAVQDNYFEQANLRLLAGDVGDIVMNTDTYPYFYDRLCSDVFVDLRSYLEKDPISSELDAAALQAMLVDDQIKALPLAINYYYAEINMALAEQLGIELDWETATWNEVLQLHDRLEGTAYKLFGVQNKERILSRIIMSNMPDLIDYETHEMNLHQSWFIDLMKEVAAIWQSDNLMEKVTYSYKGAPGENVLISINASTGGTYIGDHIGTYIHYNTQESNKSMIVPLFCGEKNPNRTSGSDYMYSITSWSKQKDAAWEFLNYLVQQSSMERIILCDRPINKLARENVLQKQLDMLFITPETPEFPLAQSYIEEMEKVYQSIDYLFDYGDIKEILWTNLLAYMEGEISLEEALVKSEEWIMLRLHE